jgi:hypothetical protein
MPAVSRCPKAKADLSPAARINNARRDRLAAILVKLRALVTRAS